MMLNGQPLENVKQYKYLGVLISSNLCWSPHIKEICKSARKMLGLLYRNFATNVTDPSVILQLYLALVRPRLEYAAEVWNPNLERDINCIERVQKFALRICSHHYQDSYEDLLHFLYQPTLRSRRIFLSLCTFFKIVKELVYFPSVSLTPLPISTSRLCHPHSFRIPFARCNGLNFSFINASVPLWNNLPIVRLSHLQIYVLLNIMYHLSSCLHNNY